jgi:hypothetical protein
VPHDLVHTFVVGAFAATLTLALTLLQIQIGWLRGAIFIGAAPIAGLLVCASISCPFRSRLDNRRG